MQNKITYNAGTLDRGDRYKLLSGLVVPRPIGWIGTVAADGRRNLAPYSFFNLVVGTPPTVLFCPSTAAHSAAMAERFPFEAR